MKNLLLLASLLLSVEVTFAAEKGAPQKKGKAKPTASQAKLGTSFKFDGSTLRGKYQSALGTSATVENDKYIDDLLGGRKHFSDRIQKDDQRN